ncbi:hypothetical protein EG328_001768 [Venturia inaequalis]|uniref:Acyltransferase 3 domain-containing protein n=1 Tax=Venturia inaequalis TaxID=5025 RepID=A0A8H3UY62_VENIN|nr:hypothetical protein EG328_001768 [Venturia inaequalis]KAE9991428.1 hypothetical protein EG327_011657 [Venturia inaequalis]
MSSHMVLCFARSIVAPCHEGRNGPIYLFQRPFFRLIAQGQSFVALFFILMGFVNSLKPLKQAQAHQFEEALMALAKSSLNRTARLVLPATAVTTIAWAACELGLFDIARKSDAYWLQINSKPKSESWSQALLDLFQKGIFQTWTWGENPYDQPQWALRYLLLGSMNIFLVLLITVTMQAKFRIVVLSLLYIYCWAAGDFLVSTNVYFGIILAQLHTLNIAAPNKSIIWRYLPFLSSLFGLFLMSFPSEYAQDAAWSRFLYDLGKNITPGQSELGRFWPGLGAQILCASILVSQDMRQLLSGQFLAYLGGISFSLYLLHGTLMRTVLAWMTFGPAILSGRDLVQPNGFYAQPSNGWFLLILPMFMVFLMAAVHIWSVKVEPIFARATKRLEDVVTGGREGRKSPIVGPADDAAYEKRMDGEKGHQRGFSNGALEQQALGGKGLGHVRMLSQAGNVSVVLHG